VLLLLIVVLNDDYRKYNRKKQRNASSLLLQDTPIFHFKAPGTLACIAFPDAAVALEEQRKTLMKQIGRRQMLGKCIILDIKLKVKMGSI